LGADILERAKRIGAGDIGNHRQAFNQNVHSAPPVSKPALLLRPNVGTMDVLIESLPVISYIARSDAASHAPGISAPKPARSWVSPPTSSCRMLSFGRVSWIRIDRARVLKQLGDLPAGADGLPLRLPLAGNDGATHWFYDEAKLFPEKSGGRTGSGAAACWKSVRASAPKRIAAGCAPNSSASNSGRGKSAMTP